MNAKILFAMMFVLLIVTASGCVQTDDGTGPFTEETDQASEQAITDNLEGNIIEETETIDIGELV
jgi:hypothetical protein